MCRLAIIAGLSILVGGCGVMSPRNLGGIATPIEPEDYGQRLCRHLDLEDLSACLSQVRDYFEAPRPDLEPKGPSNAGPFAVLMENDVYLGDYSTALLAARFDVTNGRNRCHGTYNAAATSQDALFDVYCADGRSGWADIILDTDGRNGIGKIMLDDGTRGDIVFGYTALGQATPYPYRP